jgi:YVTN family beta-propeller protein
MGVVMSPDGARVYVSTGRGRMVAVIDASTDKIISSFEVGERPWGIALSPDGKTLYSANGPSNDISVVDLATQTVTKKIKAGDRPWGVITLAPPL